MARQKKLAGNSILMMFRAEFGSYVLNTAEGQMRLRTYTKQKPPGYQTC